MLEDKGRVNVKLKVMIHYFTLTLGCEENLRHYGFINANTPLNTIMSLKAFSEDRLTWQTHEMENEMQKGRMSYTKHHICHMLSYIG